MWASVCALVILAAAAAPAVAQDAPGDSQAELSVGFAMSRADAERFAASWMGEWRGEGRRYDQAMSGLTPLAHELTVADSRNGIALIRPSDAYPFVVRYADGGFEYHIPQTDGSVSHSRVEVTAFVVSDDGERWAFISEREGMGPGGAPSRFEELQAYSGDVITRRVKAYPLEGGGAGTLTVDLRYERAPD